MVEQFIADILQQDDVRSQLSQLRKAIKEEPEKRQQCLTDEAMKRWKELLLHEDAKTRKNTALLLGNLAEEMSRAQAEEMPGCLWRAFEAETTKFLQSSYIQAMAFFDCAEYRDAIQQCYSSLLETEPAPEDIKHVRELRKALEQVLTALDETPTLSFRGMKKKHPILLEAPAYIRELLAEQVQREVRPDAKVTPFGVRVTTDSLDSILRIPLFRELYFIVRTKAGMEIAGEHIAERIVASELLPLLEELFETRGPFPFRLSCSNPGEDWDSKRLKELAYLMEEHSGHRLRNSTDRYVVEIQLRRKKDSGYGILARIPQCTQGRFAYCEQKLPTSMAPVSAAQMVALVAPYLQEGAHIIDPFCGIGTLLIERCKKVPARDVYGVDSYGEAIAIARCNTEKAHKEVYYINRDYFDFTSSHLLEEVITEFPRMENKEREQVDAFYRKFFEKTREITAPEAMLFLLSTEESCIKKQLRLHKEFALLRQIPMRGRENIFIIKKRG